LPDSEQIGAHQQNQEERPGKQQELAKAIRQINQTMEIYHTELRFILHEASGEIMVRVVKSETGEVVREIPPEYVLKIVTYVKEMLGLLLDKLV
jgi:flagellar protein FlaG